MAYAMHDSPRVELSPGVSVNEACSRKNGTWKSSGWRRGWVGLLPAVLLAACAAHSGEVHKASAPSARSSVASQGGIAPASKPGEGKGLSNYGHRLSQQRYAKLTGGNTLLRPLESGAKTKIFVASGGKMVMSVTNAAGKTVHETGRQVITADHVCWHLAGNSAPLCFRPYWNGRLLTLYPEGHQVLPAQFLVAKGNPFHLK